MPERCVVYIYILLVVLLGNRKWIIGKDYAILSVGGTNTFMNIPNSDDAYEDVDMETETDTADTESDEDISVPPHR